MNPAKLLSVTVFALAACAWAGSLTVPVQPPNGTDDTANIQSALDQCVAHGPGCTVQLAAGTYRTKQLVAYNFNGTFKGAGMDRTIIEDILYLPVTIDFGGLFCQPNTDTCTWPSLIIFVDGTFTVSDLAIHIVAGPGEGTLPWPSFGNTLVWDAVRVMGQHPTNATFERFAVEGRHDDTTGFGYNVCNAILYTGELPRSTTYGDFYFLSGSFTVRNSSFKTIGNGPINDGFVTSAKITVGGAPGAANHSEDTNTGTWISTLEDSVVDVSYNDLSGNWSAILVEPWNPGLFVPANRSRLLIHNNKLTGTAPFSNGVWLQDLPGYPATDALIRNNEIGFTTEMAWGIDAIDVRSASILNNTIAGVGNHAIALSGVTSSNLIGNDLSSFLPDGSDAASQIRLGAGTSRDVVVCSEPSDTVLNQGTANVINGCQTSSAVAAAAKGNPEIAAKRVVALRHRPF